MNMYEPKKALIVTTISGFLPQFELNDVKILQECGYEIHYASNFCNPVYSFEEEDLKRMGIRLHHIDIAKSPFALRRNVRAFRQLRRLIEKENIQLMHCHNPMGGVVGRLAAGSVKKKPYTIYTAHGFHFYKGAPLINWLLYYSAEKLLAHRTDMLITINKEDYDRAKKFRLKKNGEVARIHGVGVDTRRFRKNPELESFKRRQLGIPENAFHIVTAAELNTNKNQKVVIEAIAELGKKDIYYSICGKGEQAEELQKLIKEHHLEKQVKLLGYRTDMEEILQTADCFAFPSIREGLGIAAVEALACEVPLIAADNRGTREYTNDGYNGIVCSADSVLSFVKAIERLYSDSAYRMQLAGGCRAVAERFSKEAVGEDMQILYTKADRIIKAEEMQSLEKESRAGEAVAEAGSMEKGGIGA